MLHITTILISSLRLGHIVRLSTTSRASESGFPLLASVHASPAELGIEASTHRFKLGRFLATVHKEPDQTTT